MEIKGFKFPGSSSTHQQQNVTNTGTIDSLAGRERERERGHDRHYESKSIWNSL
jgi:hypothetical protein